jgi:RND family efflux transporter MFP subunit
VLVLAVSRLARVSGAALALGSLVAACGSPTSSSDGLDESVLGVTVAEARLETVRDVATAPGTIVPATAGDWTIYAPASAEIAELPNAEGDTVEPGDLLVRFEIASQTQALAALQLAVLDAEAARERAATEHAGQSALFDRGLVARNAYDLSRSQLAVRESALNQARAQFEAAQADSNTSVVRARFAGTVIQVWRAEGDLVAGGAGDPVMRVIDPSRLHVAVHLPVGQVARVAPGQAATVRTLLGEADEPATVAFTPAVTDPSAATAEVRLALRNPVTLPLNSPVSVEILLDVRTDALTVPSVAIQRDDLGPYVMTVGGDGRTYRRDVRVGLSTGTLTTVPAGLDAGDRVILSGVTEESEGLRVEVVR